LLTRPSLQDFDCTVFDPDPFVKIGFVSHTQDADPYISASNPGFAPSNIVDCLADPLGIWGHLSFFGVANIFSEHAGNPPFYSIYGSLPGDSEEKDTCSRDLHI